ncbi:MAG: arginine--tRNA ligase [Gammaproteobacteria bacterium]|nr:arginine--tRNA ligase [Gammaproteobacteria bacterium]
MNLKQLLDDKVTAAMSAAGIADANAVVKQAQRIEFGHYQANGIMGAAKKQKANPRELAEQVLDQLGDDHNLHLEVAGPGFINITLTSDFLADALQNLQNNQRLGIEERPSKVIVVDYSAPNLAKEMHIGHLRSTTIGDATVRILEFLGQEVIRANHVGDWGAQFGSLLAYMDQLATQGEKLSSELKDLEKFYQSASALFKSDETFAAKARRFVVKLQSGDEKCRALWKEFIAESTRHCQAVYDQLNITLTPDDIMPESAYNDALPAVVEELEQRELLVESDGAKCVFLDEFKGKDGKPLPAIVQKSDGGYPYMATDLAAVRYRTNSLNAHEVLYFVGAQQLLHLRQVFAVATAGGYITNNQRFRHLPIGWVLKSDGTPFKTRDGADVKLIDVLDEAIDRAYKLVDEKNPDLSPEDKNNVANVIGIGAVKYAELSKNRVTDYIFDWDTMLSFEGNTAPYLQYAYTRIRSIFRRENILQKEITGEFHLTEKTETQLAVKLLQFSEAIDGVIEDYQANILCNYLFDLAGIFMSFYEACPVLKASEPHRTSRLLLCDLTARTLHKGLDLLGIETVEQM